MTVRPSCHNVRTLRHMRNLVNVSISVTLISVRRAINVGRLRYSLTALFSCVDQLIIVLCIMNVSL